MSIAIWLSQLLEESTSTRDESSDSLLGERLSDESLTTMMVKSIEIDQGIVGINSSLTDEPQVP